MNRRRTRTIHVGPVTIGSEHPIRIQSMTTSPTHDVEATVEQIRRLSEAACDIVRVTVQGRKEADACEAIKNRLVQLGDDTPLVADIHFYPPAALRVVDFIEKVRINPGNFADKRATFREDQNNFEDGLDRIRAKFLPLVEKCKQLGRALRIGTNHGSLADRIMTRYGDSPEGMVASAVEYAELCRELDYHNFVFSMKSSNPRVMIKAYRLLVQRMDELGWDYPLHLGVTEAGAGQEGRVKSAIGIGSLLMDGIGDTIRVSLTEDPWHEIEPCQQLVAIAEGKRQKSTAPTSYEKRHVVLDPSLPLHKDGTVWVRGNDSDADARISELEIATPEEQRFASHEARILELNGDSSALEKQRPAAIIYRAKHSLVSEGRHLVVQLKEQGLAIPVLWSCSGDAMLQAAEAGSLLCDGLGEGVVTDEAELGFQILQGCRMRATKTEFISCPSCGRTLFDLQDVSERIRKQTEHLPGVKIAIMGCIVNGPGEMADADFGYVGSKAGMVDLYVEKDCVERNIPMEEADARLIDLIKRHGRWVEPQDSCTQVVSGCSS